ncbi:MAG: hypothetical protein ACJAXS_000366 [Colwellia sp.]|jgi:hypothetical protein
MKRVPSSLVKTWIFLIKSKDPRLAKQKFYAYRKIRELFGNTDIAQLYIEQYIDRDIEVVII